MSFYSRLPAFIVPRGNVYNVSTKPLQSQLRIVLGEYGQCGENGLTKPLLSGGGRGNRTRGALRLNGFQVLRGSCYPVRLVLSGAVLFRVSCYLVRLLLSCVIWFCLQRVYSDSRTEDFSGDYA